MSAVSEVSVLVADDDETFRDVLAAEFEMRGFRVFTAANAVDALEVARTQTLHVVISDFLMPEVDGRRGGSGADLFHQLERLYRDDAERRPWVFCLLTGYGDLLPPTIVAGACAVFEKPVDRDALLRHVFDAIQRRLGDQAGSVGQ